MHTRKRTVHHYEIHLHPRTKTSEIPEPSCANFSELLAAISDLDIQKFEISRDSQHVITLEDWSYDAKKHCYELLINKADATLSDVTLRDLNTKATRKAGKKKQEGIETSSHVLLRPNNDQRTAFILMTMGAGISIKTVSSLLFKLTNSAKAVTKNRNLFEFPHPSSAKQKNGKALVYKVSYSFEGYAFKGQTLNEALKNGTFESMELITFEQNDFDDGGQFRILERSLSIFATVPETVTGASITNLIRRALGQTSTQDFDRARIHYKDNHGKHSTTTLDVAALDATFTHSEVITFDTDVEAQQTSLSSTVLNKMKELLTTGN